MAEASFVRESDDNRLVADAAVVSGEVYQLKDGRAAYYTGLNAAASSDSLNFNTEGKVLLPKTASIVLLDGGRAYWDHSANKVHYKKVDDRDFYLGRIVGDAASADTTCVVDLNVNQPYDVDLSRHGFNSVIVGTAAAGGFGYPRNLGGTLEFEMTSTNEAQKVDALSVDGFSTIANAIVETIFRVESDGGTGSQDITIGIANGTHATDADSIADQLWVHLDGNITKINLQSKDGTTTVAATDSTAVYVEGTNTNCRVEVWFDMRTPADVQIYVNGVLMLGSTVFDVSAYAGPWYLLVHAEKSSGTDVYKLAIDRHCARLAQQ